MLKLLDTVPESTKQGGYDLYLPETESNVSIDSFSAIMYLAASDEYGYLPEFALQHNLGAALDLDTLKNVIVDVSDQIPNASDDFILDGLNYYLKYYTFKTFK